MNQPDPIPGPVINELSPAIRAGVALLMILLLIVSLVIGLLTLGAAFTNRDAAVAARASQSTSLRLGRYEQDRRNDEIVARAQRDRTERTLACIGDLLLAESRHVRFALPTVTGDPCTGLILSIAAPAPIVTTTTLSAAATSGRQRPGPTTTTRQRHAGTTRPPATMTTTRMDQPGETTTTLPIPATIPQ